MLRARNPRVGPGQPDRFDTLSLANRNSKARFAYGKSGGDDSQRRRDRHPCEDGEGTGLPSLELMARGRCVAHRRRISEGISSVPTHQSSNSNFVSWSGLILTGGFGLSHTLRSETLPTTTHLASPSFTRAHRLTPRPAHWLRAGRRCLTMCYSVSTTARLI